MGLFNDVRLGAQGPIRLMSLGALIALPFSGLIAILLSLLTEIQPGHAVLVTGVVQLVLGYAIAGRLTRRSRSTPRTDF